MQRPQTLWASPQRDSFNSLTGIMGLNITSTESAFAQANKIGGTQIPTIGSECGPTDDVDCYTPYSERPETYIIPVLFAIIFVVGVLGNGTLVIIFLRHRAMRNIPNTYILSLALADLLVIVICVPLASIVYTFESWPWGSTLCRVTECAKDISIGVSVFTLTALAGERYCAIVNPLRKLQTRPLTVFTASMIWLLAILCASPAAIVSDAIPLVLSNTTNHTIVICTPFGPERPYKKLYTQYTVVGKAITYYFLPLSIIGVLYALMARRLHLSTREMPGEISGPQSRAQARARRHVARMVVTFVIVFIACFLPHHVFQLWFHLNPNASEEYDEFWHVVRMVGFCFSFLNSCVNPVALYCVSGVFRQHFHRYLCCRQIAQPHRLGHHSSATGACDTSFMSVRRHTTTNHSVHHANNNSTLISNHHPHNNLQRQTSLQLQHTVINNNGGASPTQSIILSEKRYTVVGKAITYYFLPLSIIGVLYALMARRLHLSTREMPGEISGPQSRAQARARRHVARMVVTFVIVFIACFLPHHVFQLWFHLNPNASEEYDEFWHVVRMVGFCFSFLNSCVNPVALYCVSGVFRQHFHRYLCCRQIAQPHRLGHHSSATGACDTSFMSVRRHTTTNHSVHHANNNSTLISNHHPHNNLQRQTSLQLQHTVINNNGGASPTQSIILSEKR